MKDRLKRPQGIIRSFHSSIIKKWMLFIDGENFVLRAQDIAKEKEIELVQGEYFEPNVFIWPYLMFHTEILGQLLILKKPPLRSYYYTSVVGDDEKVDEMKRRLWQIGFHPVIFKKTKGRKGKGVDIALTKDVLSHAFLDNYDLAILITGDADYLPLIQEVKRIGKLVYLVFHEDANVDENLIREADSFNTISIDYFENTLNTITLQKRRDRKKLRKQSE